MFDMMKMMGKLKEVQERMKEAQKQLEFIQVSAESGAGMVKATANGKKQLIKLEIDKSLIDPNDPEMLQDLIVAATNKALQEAEALGKEEMKKATDGMLPNIPGMDLSSML
ncbi:YbaB/EbfC family nucleoid-associated protein [Peijinzhouia sedimentorum]